MTDHLRDRIAAAIWERQNPGRRWTDCEYRWRADAEEDADAVLAALLATGPDREQRIRLDDLNSDQLDGLYDDLDRYTEIVGEMNDNAIRQAKELGEQLDEAGAAIAERTVEINRLTELADQQRQRAETAEAERDTARQHAAAIAAQRDRLRQRMNNLADRWDHALAPDKPYARTLRAEISVAPFEPEAALAVREYQAEDGSQKWAARCWGTETCDGWLSLDHDTEQWAETARDRHITEQHTEPTP